MKTTETYGFPYPECDPPLVKDASQISHMAILANRIDAEVQRVDTLAEKSVTNPAAARLRINPAVNTTAVQVMPTFVGGSVVFNNANWTAPVVQSGGLRVPEDAWFLVGCHAETTSAVSMQVNVRLTLNGSPASSWSNPGFLYAGTSHLTALAAVPLQLTTGNILNMEIKHSAAAGTAWTYRPHLWAVKLVAA